MINLENYPKGKEKVEKFARELLGALQKEITKDIPEGTELPSIEGELVDYFIKNILTNNKRSLYDFFDREDIHLLVDYADGFYWQIKYKNEAKITTIIITEPPVNHKDRISCEDEGFDHCFKLMENE